MLGRNFLFAKMKVSKNPLVFVAMFCFPLRLIKNPFSKHQGKSNGLKYLYVAPPLLIADAGLGFALELARSGADVFLVELMGFGFQHAMHSPEFTFSYTHEDYIRWLQQLCSSLRFMFEDDKDDLDHQSELVTGENSATSKNISSKPQDMLILISPGIFAKVALKFSTQHSNLISGIVILQPLRSQDFVDQLSSLMPLGSLLLYPWIGQLLMHIRKRCIVQSYLQKCFPVNGFYDIHHSHTAIRTAYGTGGLSKGESFPENSLGEAHRDFFWDLMDEALLVGARFPLVSFVRELHVERISSSSDSDDNSAYDEQTNSVPETPSSGTAAEITKENQVDVPTLLVLSQEAKLALSDDQDWHNYVQDMSGVCSAIYFDQIGQYPELQQSVAVSRQILSWSSNTCKMS